MNLRMINTEYMKYIIETLINFLIELILGYVVIIILSKIILYPGRDKIQNVTDKKRLIEKKIEIIKVRKWICIGWTVIIVIFNIYILVK